jgi:hypothetical protein
MMSRSTNATTVASVYSRSAAGSSSAPSLLAWLSQRAILPSAQSDAPL